MPIYLGIDGGGSKTTCVVGDETSVLGRATASGSNPVRVGKDASTAALRTAVQEACRQASIHPSNVIRTCIGIAGFSAPDTREHVQRALAECVAGDILIVGDMEIAIAAALGERPGVIVIAGTGSIAFGRSASGYTARAGGWGHAISDEGSGHWIGKRAVSAITCAHDFGQTTGLQDAVLSAWKLGSFEELVKAANATPAPDFAALFPAVLGAASAGDETARCVLNDAGRELARLASSVIDQLFLRQEAVRVALAGGVFAHSSQVRVAFHRALRERRDNLAVCFAVQEPVLGALTLARICPG